MTFTSSLAALWLALLGGYLLILVLIQAALAALSAWNLYRRRRGGVGREATPADAMAVIVPAHNEEACLPLTLETFGRQSAAPSQLIVVDDGSTDRTAEVAGKWVEGAAAGVRASVLSVPRAGMARAYDSGLSEVDCPLTCLSNADVEVGPHALAEMRRHFANPAAVAVSCWVWPRVSEGRYGPAALCLMLCQIIEYARAIIWRPGLQQLGALSIVEGRLGMYRTEWLRALRTMRTTPSAIDYVLTLELHRLAAERGVPCQVIIEPRATVWTDTPLTLRALFAQRRRWAGGFLRAYALNRRMAFRREYGAVGMIELPIRMFTSVFPVVECLLWATCLALTLLRHPSAGLAWTVLLAYVVCVAAQLYLSLILSRRYTVYRWKGRFNLLLWAAVPLAALVWEPLKGLTVILGWVKMPWRKGPWMPVRRTSAETIES